MRVSQSELEHQRLLEWARMGRDHASLMGDVREAKEGLQAATMEYHAKLEELRAAQADARRAHQESFEKGRIIGRIQLLQQLLKRAELASEGLALLSNDELQPMEEFLMRQLNGPKGTKEMSPANPT